MVLKKETRMRNSFKIKKFFKQETERNERRTFIVGKERDI